MRARIVFIVDDHSVEGTPRYGAMCPPIIVGRSFKREHVARKTLQVELITDLSPPLVTSN